MKRVFIINDVAVSCTGLHFGDAGTQLRLETGHRKLDYSSIRFCTTRRQTRWTTRSSRETRLRSSPLMKKLKARFNKMNGSSVKLNAESWRDASSKGPGAGDPDHQRLWRFRRCSPRKGEACGGRTRKRGCSGFRAMRLELRARERDNVFEENGARVFVDPKSYVYLDNTTIDYEETLMRHGFVFQNPQATHSCGCGSSFTV